MKVYDFLYKKTFVELNKLCEVSKDKTINNKDGFNLLVIDNEQQKNEYLMDYGKYLTVFIENSEILNMKLCVKYARNLSKLLQDNFISNINGKKILVIGLGNRNISADSLGEKTATSIITTDYINKNGTIVYSFTPNVMGVTNIQTADLVEKVCELTKPNYIVAIDSLCAKSCKRLSSTIQVSDSGIAPGSGINNAQKALDEKNLKCKIISIGVPLMIKEIDIIKDFFDKNFKNNSNCKSNNDKNSYEKNIDIHKFQNKNIIFTDSQVSAQINTFSKIISMALNLLFFNELGI